MEDNSQQLSEIKEILLRIEKIIVAYADASLQGTRSHELFQDFIGAQDDDNSDRPEQ